MGEQDALLQQALAHHQAKDYSAARDLYSRILDQDCENVDAWHLLGVLCHQIRRHDVALTLIGRALALRPDYAEAHNNMGNALTALLRLDEAAMHYLDAVTLKPDFAEAWINLGDLLRRLGRFEDALEPYRRVAALLPGSAAGPFQLSTLLEALGRHGEAEVEARKACALEPGSALPWISLGRALIGQKRQVEAAECLERALHLQPDSVEVLLETAGTFERWRMPERAATFYRQALERQPDHGLALSRLIDMQLSLCDWSGYEGFCRRLTGRIEQEMAAGQPISTDVFNLHALPVDQAFTSQVARYKGERLRRDAENQSRTLNFTFPARRAGRIRVGYLLPYTTKQSMPLVLEPVIERHDRDRFEIHGYSLMACDGVPFSRRFRGHFDRFGDMVKMSPAAAARRIHEDGIDLLIDTTGHTSVNWLEVLALRPAPVQAHYLGYSLTTGADFVQYLITDRRFIPPEWADLCSEKLVWLPDSFMATVRAPISTAPVSRAAERLPEDAFVFANFNHPCKFEPGIFAVWMRLLRRLPKAVLWFGQWMHGTRDNLRREAATHGIDGERLIFAELVDHPEHLARLGLADLALDNRFHGGGVTTVDALWAGLPVLTISGDSPAARLGATLSAAAGVPEMIAPDLAAYERLAVELAGDPERLAAIRARLRRQNSPLFDGDRYRRHLEAAFEAMWRNYQEGGPPRHIAVPRLD